MLRGHANSILKVQKADAQAVHGGQDGVVIRLGLILELEVCS